MLTQLATKFFKKRGWLLQWPAMVVIGCRRLPGLRRVGSICVFLRHIIVCLYTACACAQQLFTYTCAAAVLDYLNVKRTLA